MKKYAEDFPVGTKLVFVQPPPVRAPAGELPFCAPSTRGTVYGHVGKGPEGIGRPGVVVRFRYKNPTGGTSWSLPLELSGGIEATEDTET